MATKPGILTEWPWQRLGSFKYLLLTPIVAEVLRKSVDGQLKWTDATLLNLAAFLLRCIHNQIWISVSRHQNARSRHQIQAKSIKFEQVDRESTWDENILLYTLVFEILRPLLVGPDVPFWNSRGLLIIMAVHAGPVEFVYYWLHRALHHPWLYSRYHSHHHSSFVTEPITSVVHPFAEHLMYLLTFSLGPLAILVTGTLSSGVLMAYILWIDVMNNLGHCNFEFFSPKLFKSFPPLKYLVYTPSFHSLHHSQVNTNFCLFMPLYDLLYGTLDRSSDTLLESAAKGRDEKLDCVYLTHLTGPLSIFHTRLGFASFAAGPYKPTKWYVWMLWPLAQAIRLLLGAFGKTFVSEKNRMDGINMQTWVIPRYASQYTRPSEKPKIRALIADAIMEAEQKGANVVTLGLLNKDIGAGGLLSAKSIENLKIRVSDGSALAAAWVVNCVPKAETKVFVLCGYGGGEVDRLQKGIISILCKRGLKVQVLAEHFGEIQGCIPPEFQQNLLQASSFEEAGRNCKTWIVGRALKEGEETKAETGSRIVNMCRMALRGKREDCVYESSPAMTVPPHLENLHNCENWLPRRVMSAWRVGGIVHALEGWQDHEWDSLINTESVGRAWDAATKHGFEPYYHANPYQYH